MAFCVGHYTKAVSALSGHFILTGDAINPCMHQDLSYDFSSLGVYLHMFSVGSQNEQRRLER